MATTLVMPTMDTMDTHIDTMLTMARDLLMLSQRPMLMLSMDTTAMELTSVMLTTDTHMPAMVSTTARDLLMLKPMLILTTDTTHTTVTDMPTTDTLTDTHTLTDMESKMLTKS